MSGHGRVSDRSGERGKVIKPSRRGGRAGGRGRGGSRAVGIGRASRAAHDAQVRTGQEHQQEEQQESRQMAGSHSVEPGAATNLDTLGMELADTLLSFRDLPSSSTRQLQGEDHDPWDFAQ